MLDKWPNSASLIFFCREKLTPVLLQFFVVPSPALILKFCLKNSSHGLNILTKISYFVSIQAECVYACNGMRGSLMFSFWLIYHFIEK